MVERKTTASYWARLASVNCGGVLGRVDVKPLAAPSCWIAAMPCGMESWRKPAVLEKTSTFSSGSAPGSSTVTEPVIRAWTWHRNV